MGRARGFRRALMRRALQRKAASPCQGGPHKGIDTAQVPWEIYVACSDGESVDARTYEALHTTIDLDGLYDILEMKQVQQSWIDAAARNARED